MFNHLSNWKTRRFDEFLTELTERNKKSLPYEPLSVTQGKGVILQSQKYNKRIASEDTKNYKLAPKGSFIINPNYLNFGAIGQQQAADIGIVSSIYGVFVNNDSVDTKFLSYLLRSRRMINEYNRFANGGCAVVNTGQLHGMHVRLTVPINEFLKIKWTFPPLIEQQKIAAILSSVDEAIEKTEQIITQTEKVKIGLMQQLLTKGIGHTTFKKTAIGEIPDEWKVVRISDVASTTSGGTPSRQNSNYYGGDIPWIKTGELKNKYLHDTDEKITKDGLEKSSTKTLPVNTPVLAMYGATIGNVSITKIESTSNQACCAIIPKQEHLNHEFLYYLLVFHKERIVKMGVGGAQPNISQKLVNTIEIPLPNFEEQVKLADFLSSVDDKIQKEYEKSISLKQIKKGLMQQLLTGKMRVPVEEDEVVET